MSFVLPPIESNSSICLPNITASTHFLLNEMESGTRKKFTEMQFMRCILSVMHADFKRFGDICGGVGCLGTYSCSHVTT